MADFVLAYRSPDGYEPSADTTAAWRAWFSGMGSALQDLGKPVFSGATVGNTSAGSTRLGGFSIVTAEDLDAALALAKGCPVIAIGGGVDVGELSEVPS
jgi:hypothetical protein